MAAARFAARLCMLVLPAADAVNAQMSPPAGATALRADHSSFAAIAQRALQAHPDIQARRSAFEAQGRGVVAAGAGFRPRVDLSANTGTERSSLTDSQGGTVTGSGPTRRATLSLRQPLFDGSEISSETERQARVGNVRYFELRQAEDTLLLEMARAWVDVERQRALIEIAQANVAAHERLVALVQTRVAAGVGKGADLDQAQGRLASARLSLASDMGALGEASARFQRSALVPPPTNVAPLALASNLLPSSEADALSAAVAASPTLRTAAENGAAVSAEWRVRQSAFWPRVAIEGRHDLNARTPTLRDAASSSVLLTFNYNLYAGGGDTAREQDAILRLASARQQFQDALVTLRQGVLTTWAEAARQVSMNQNARAYAEAVGRTRDAYRVQYDIGQRSLLDLLNTENEVSQARRQETSSRADALQAQLRLMSLAGRLHAFFGVARNEAQPYLAPVADPVDARVVLAGGPMSTPSMAAVTAPEPPAPAPAPVPATTPAARPAPSTGTPPAVATAPAVAAQPSTATVGSVLPPSALMPSAAALTPAVPPPSTAGSGPSSTSGPSVPSAAPAAPSSAPLRPAVSASDPNDRPALVAGRFGPGVTLRMPAELNRAFASWLSALEAGSVESLSRSYVSTDARPQTWEPAAGSRPGAARRVRLIQAEHVDDDRFFTGSSAQFSLLTALDEGPGRQRCVRSAQVWRKTGDADGVWRIARERAIALPQSSCRRG